MDQQFFPGWQLFALLFCTGIKDIKCSLAAILIVRDLGHSCVNLNQNLNVE